MNRKRKYIPQSFESCRPNKDTSANMYDSMLNSDAFKTKLSKRQRLLYVYCKSQYYGKRKPKSDYPDIPEFALDTCFYFNWHIAKNTGLYTESMSSDFYTDMRKLVEMGFIDIVGKEHITEGKRNIYKYSDRWHSEK